MLCLFEDADGCVIRYSHSTGVDIDASDATSVCNLRSEGGNLILAGCFGRPGGDNSLNHITVALGPHSSPTFSTVNISEVSGSDSSSLVCGSLIESVTLRGAASTGGGKTKKSSIVTADDGEEECSVV